MPSVRDFNYTMGMLYFLKEILIILFYFIFYNFQIIILSLYRDRSKNGDFGARTPL